MAEETKTDTPTEKRNIWVTPCVDVDCGCSDETEDPGTMRFSFEIPGVEKDKVHLHVIKEGLRLSAPRNDGIRYVSEYGFSCPADAEHVKAQYRDGILDVTVPYACPDPYAGSDPVPIA